MRFVSSYRTGIKAPAAVPVPALPPEDWPGWAEAVALDWMTDQPCAPVDAGPNLTHATTFPLTESPMVEDGLWTQGGTVGGASWQNVITSGGLGYGAGPAGSYEDCLAHRSNINNAKHYARGTVYKAGGYTPPDNQEIELIVGANISANSVLLYEWLVSFSGSSQIVRWDGAAGTFTFDLPVTGPGVGALASGDVMEMRYDATNTTDVVITCYLNGALVFTAHDTTAGRILTGNPGLSFFARAGSGLDMAGYCFSEWEGGVLP